MLALGVGLSGVNAWADFTPEAFYVDYAFNVPTDILTSHRRAIVHPEAQVDLAAAANAGTIVFAYISVGELGANAPHRAEALSLGLPLRGKNTIWNSDLLDLTSGAWAEFIVETIARAAVQKGFTGFFLDTLDSIEIDATAAQVELQRAGLVALINRLHSTFPSLPIVVNRGFSTLPQLAGVAQGLLVESVYAAYDFETKVYRPTTADTTAQLVTIMQNAVAAGFEVFVLDYADPTNPADALLTANRILQAGYHAFVSTPDLTGVALGPWVPVAPMITSQPLGLTLREGQDWELRVTNLGAPAPTYVWYRDGVAVTDGGSSRLIGENAEVTDAGDYRVEISNRYGTVSSASVRVEVSASARPGRLTNLSARAWATGGAAQLTPGVVSVGPVDVLARAVGPTLADFQVVDFLPDPNLAVVRVGLPQITSANWQDGDGGAAVRSAAVLVGAFPLRENSLDAALLFDLQGAATLPVGTIGQEEGTTLVELFELPGDEQAGVLTNLSVRGNLRTQDDAMVVGFVLGGETASQILIRAAGPGLSQFGVSAVLANPAMKIYRGEAFLAQNDDWSVSAPAAQKIASRAQAVGAFPFAVGSQDAAALLTLPPGSYTAVVSGTGSGTGVVLAEIYLLR